MDDNQKTTLKKWRARCKRAQIAHNYTAISYIRFHTCIGILLIILTIGGSVITFAPFPETQHWIPIIISISATMFAAFQTFMNFSEQAEIHRTTARRYGEIKKEIEYILDFISESKQLEDIVDKIRAKEVEISQDAPNTLVRNWNRAKKETLEENDKCSIRNST